MVARPVQLESIPSISVLPVSTFHGCTWARFHYDKVSALTYENNMYYIRYRIFIDMHDSISSLQETEPKIWCDANYSKTGAGCTLSAFF